MTFHAIAIDGPAASGKSTLARALAERLGLVMVNSGAMYRAVTWKVLRKEIDPADTDAVIRLLDEMDIHCGQDGCISTIRIDGTDPTPFLRDPEINANVSTVSAIPQVRERLVALQRDYLKRTHVVMEGRDIGSVVFPESPFKYYIDASEQVRSARRRAQGHADQVAERDRIDSTRKASPLIIPTGATVIDNSHLTLDQAVEAVLTSLKSQGLPTP
jgi:cytidylate kinase